MKRVSILVLALGAALVSGCGTSSEVRRWFASDRTLLSSKNVPIEPIYVDVLGGGDLQQDLANEITRRFSISKYLKRALTPDAQLFLEVEPLDSYFGEDNPTFGPTVVWTTIVFRASLVHAGSDKPLLEGVIASYKGYEPQDWDKLTRVGLRRAAVRDGVQKLVNLIETNVPKPEAAPPPVTDAGQPATSAGKNPSPH